MSALRLASTLSRRAPRAFATGRRGYAEAADKIKLSLVLPHQVRGRPPDPASRAMLTDPPRTVPFHLGRCSAGQLAGCDW